MFEDQSMSPAYSPASSVMSMGSSESSSEPPSPFAGYPPEIQNRYSYYENEYGNENNGVCSPSSHNLRPLPVPTHTSIYDQNLQAKFDQLVLDNNRIGLEELLRCYSHCIDINKLDRSSGQTPLQQFCVNGDLALVQLMVRYGADTQLRSRDGWSSVHYATFSGVQEVLLYVLRCCSRR